VFSHRENRRNLAVLLPSFFLYVSAAEVETNERSKTSLANSGNSYGVPSLRAWLWKRVVISVETAWVRCTAVKSGVILNLGRSFLVGCKLIAENYDWKMQLP
jgi:hypothetical protein